jgi:hypothetical protein
MRNVALLCYNFISGRRPNTKTFFFTLHYEYTRVQHRTHRASSTTCFALLVHIVRNRTPQWVLSVRFVCCDARFVCCDARFVCCDAIRGPDEHPFIADLTTHETDDDAGECTQIGQVRHVNGFTTNGLSASADHVRDAQQLSEWDRKHKLAIVHCLVIVTTLLVLREDACCISGWAVYPSRPCHVKDDEETNQRIAVRHAEPIHADSLALLT